MALYPIQGHVVSDTRPWPYNRGNTVETKQDYFRVLTYIMFSQLFKMTLVTVIQSGLSLRPTKLEWQNTVHS